MITLLNYEKAQGGDYVCHFSVGSTEMTYAEAEKEFKKISDSAFVVSPATMSIPFALGVPGYGSTITMHYNTGVTVFYKAAGEYTSDVIRGDEILDDPEAVDVDWKTIFESSDDGIPKIFPKTHDGKKYYAMTGCIAPEIVPGLEITENGHYGWPVDKDPNEWTDEEWGQGPITDVYVNVPPQSAKLEELNHIITQNGTETIGPNEGYDGFSKINLVVNVPHGLVETTIVCTLNGEEYTADFGQIKEALRDKNSNAISFKLSNFDDLVTLGSATYYGGDMDYFKVNRVSSGDSGLESVFYNVKFTGDRNEMGHSEFMALLKAKIPYSFIEHGC